MSNLDKNSIINMENTARYQPRSKLNVAFSTADRDSAVFIFNVTKGNKPLLLSSENVVGHIALKHSDGSFVKDTLHFAEPNINGRFEYYIPNDMLQREGTVTMQIFISEKGNSNVIVAERIVTFDIEKSIVSQISAETKLQYIVEYDELQAIIANRITDIENNMANAEDYVSQLEQAREKGLTDIEVAKTDSVKALNDLADKRLEEINSKASEYSSKFDDDKQYIDDKHQAFKESVMNSGVVTQGESKEWQKYKLTNDDGNAIIVSSLDMENIEEKITKAGFYWLSSVTNGPVNISGVLLAIHGTSDNYKKIIYSPHNSNRIFVKSKNGYSWVDWKEVPTLSPDEKIETQNSAESRANETLADANRYTDGQITNQHGVLFEGTANGVGKTINLSEALDNFVVLYIFVSFPGGLTPVLGNPYGNSSMTLCLTNITDTDGSSGGHYEVTLSKTTRTQLTIVNDVYYDIGLVKGSGPNANRCTITRIVGVRK
ncbi:BppU family phage baseplate upper protein [Staphylococcus xylosus]|uniref:BppU family phage baseplate upper protein n=1 Tax=Staphylococcus xylosus TaxID=1288 RepID=UPI002DBA633C|nr:BppU family phage baseplate upper protein [Staphylococcus xylosus]MEB8175512.1 BppU family phage baseplate upper protein [Staphylococcus xylosus]